MPFTRQGRREFLSGFGSAPCALLFQDSDPSWMHMSNQYSTIWEDWGRIENGTATHRPNHDSKGAVISFLHHHMVGLFEVGRGTHRRFWSSLT